MWPTFLTMSAAVGAAAATIPIVIHILNRRRYQRVRWAAMEFLLMAEKITRKRVRLEQILLLIIRTLAVLLLCWALARPVLKNQNLPFVGKENRNVVVLLDDSYSMALRNARGGSAFDRARASLKGLFKKLKSGDAFTLIRTSDAYRWVHGRAAGAAPTDAAKARKPEQPIQPYIYISHRVIGPSTLEAIQEKLDHLKPTDVHTDFYLAFQLLQAEAKSGDEAARFNREVIVISDYRRFGWTVRGTPGRYRTASPELDENGKPFAELLRALTGDSESEERAVVTLVDVGEEASNNVSIESVSYDDSNKPVTKPVTQARIGMQVKLLNRGDTIARNVEVTRRVDGKVVETLKTDLEPGGSKEVLFEFKLEEPGAYNIEFVVADSLEADSHYYHPLNLRDGIRVLMISGEKGAREEDRETYLLRNALFPRKSSDIDEFNKRDVFLEPKEKVGLREAGSFDDYDLVIIANDAVDVSDDGKEKVKGLEEYVANGGAVFFFLGDKIDPDDFNAVFYKDGAGLSPVKLGEPEGDPKNDKMYWELAPAALSHPTLARLEQDEMFQSDTNLPSIRRRFPLTTQKPRAGQDVTELFSYRRPGGTAQMPAVVMKEYADAGLTVVFSFTADGEWTDFLTNPKKAVMSLPFLHLLTLWITQRHTRIDPREVYVGNPIALTFDPRRPPLLPEMKLPDDNQYTSAQGKMRITQGPGDRKIHRFVLNDTYRAGRHMVRDGAGAKSEKGRAGRYEGADRDLPVIFAANVFLAESDLTRTSAEELEEHFPGFVFEMTAELSPSGGARKELWKDLLYVVLGLLILESILAALFSRSGAKA